MTAYRLESAEPAGSSLHIEAVGIPSTVNGAGSNELNAQGGGIVDYLWPQPSSSHWVYYIGGTASTKGKVGLVECEHILWLGAECGDGCKAAVDPVRAPNHRLVLGNDGSICASNT